MYIKNREFVGRTNWLWRLELGWRIYRVSVLLVLAGLKTYWSSKAKDNDTCTATSNRSIKRTDNETNKVGKPL